MTVWRHRDIQLAQERLTRIDSPYGGPPEGAWTREHHFERTTATDSRLDCGKIRA